MVLNKYVCYLTFNSVLFYLMEIFTGTNRFEVTLEKSNKNFSKKIQQVFMGEVMYYCCCVVKVYLWY